MTQFDPSMVAQMLMQPIQRASENLGGGPFGIGADAGGSYFVDPEVAARTGYGTAVTGTSFFPGAGIVDAYGGAVDVTGQPLPSFSENIKQGNYLDAALQGLGVAGDVATFAAPATLGASALVGAMLKAPRAATKYKFENPIKVYQGRSKKGTKDFINPTDFYGDKKVSFGTNELVTAEQFANKQTVSYPGRARDGSEGPTKTTLIPGDVAELEFDIQNPLEVNRKDIGFKRDNEKEAIAEARAKGHDGLKIVYDNSDKIDFVAFDSEQVRVVNPSLYPDRDYAYSPTSAELPNDVEIESQASPMLQDAANQLDIFTKRIQQQIAKVEPPTETQPGIIAFHGSGADFDEFRLDKIGTGEGAAAFGYGLYFSNNEDIGDFYKRALSPYEFSVKGEKIQIDPRSKNQRTQIGKALGMNVSSADVDTGLDEVFVAISDALQTGKDPLVVLKEGHLESLKQIDESIKTITNPEALSREKLARKFAIEDYESSKEYLKDFDIKVNPQGGKTYKVGIQPKPEELLDYDLPLSEQPKILEKLENTFGARELNDLSLKNAGVDSEKLTGRRLYKLLKDEYGSDKLASEELSKSGIKGSKYKPVTLDKPNPKETNFVIFDDKIIKVLEKYGIVGPVAVSATAAALRDDDGST